MVNWRPPYGEQEKNCEICWKRHWVKDMTIDFHRFISISFLQIFARWRLRKQTDLEGWEYGFSWSKTEKIFKDIIDNVIRLKQKSMVSSLLVTPMLFSISMVMVKVLFTSGREQNLQLTKKEQVLYMLLELIMKSLVERLSRFVDWWQCQLMPFNWSILIGSHSTRSRTETFHQNVWWQDGCI